MIFFKKKMLKFSNFVQWALFLPLSDSIAEHVRVISPKTIKKKNGRIWIKPCSFLRGTDSDLFNYNPDEQPLQSAEAMFMFITKNSCINRLYAFYMEIPFLIYGFWSYNTTFQRLLYVQEVLIHII